MELDADAEWLKLIFQKDGSLARLRALADTNAQNMEVLRSFARGQEYFSEYLDAASTYLKAADVAADKAGRVSCSFAAAEQYARDGLKDEAVQTLEQAEPEPCEMVEAEVVFLSHARTIASLLKDEVLKIAAMDRLLELRPEDNDLRFALAYLHSELGDEELAFFHYANMPAVSRGRWPGIT